MASGGQEKDLKELHEYDLEWLASLPALAKEGKLLLMHDDDPFYPY
jgi:hypothetical protein